MLDQSDGPQAGPDDGRAGPRPDAYGFSQSILIVSRLCLKSTRIASVMSRGASGMHNHFKRN